MDEDMFHKLGQMLNSDQIPDDLKNMLGNLGKGTTDSSESSHASPEIDLDMLLKLKGVMDQMNSSSDDPRSNLLNSLKPYLKPSRKEKVDQYANLLRMGKIFQVMNLTNGDSKHE